ncbi:MAG: hypothetical protein KatS3mg060_1640 [Dehalococcoidia bacterium]|nr:MAG: hypothetical protein KatS3mg060_1640 [Dehalococcoidia bacterium]
MTGRQAPADQSPNRVSDRQLAARFPGPRLTNDQYTTQAADPLVPYTSWKMNSSLNLLLAIVPLHDGQIGPDELVSYAVGTAAALGLAYLLSKVLDRLGGRNVRKR